MFYLLKMIQYDKIQHLHIKLYCDVFNCLEIALNKILHFEKNHLETTMWAGAYMLICINLKLA